MKVLRLQLNSILQDNVCDIRFVRRRPKLGQLPTRRMLCTKSYSLLNSTNGRISLNYVPPTHPLQFNEAKENLLVVWDILMQEFRNVNMDDCYLVEQIPANDDFWKYYNERLYIMTAEDKIAFMNS